MRKSSTPLKDHDDSSSSESEDESISEEDEGSSNDTLWSCIVLTSWVILLVMILLAELASYDRAAGGDLTFRTRVYISGVLGILCTLAVCFLAFKWTLVFRILGGCCGFLFFVTFIVFMALPVVPPSSIIKIDTTLSFQDFCTGNNPNYVSVSELLTYSFDAKDLEKGVVAEVDRGVFRANTPSDFQVEGVGSVKNARIVGQDINARLAESAKKAVTRKIVKITFDEIAVQGSVPVEISVRLNYTARIAKPDEECLGGYKCGAWRVPGSRTSGVMTSLSVNGGDAKESTDNPGKYTITLDSPNLDLGNACPYALSADTAYSWMWIVAVCLLLMGFCLTIPMASADAARDYAIPVTIGVIMIVIGGILGAVAYAHDKSQM